ncbi:BTB and MATH domain-containing protein 42 [Parasteatoda tepidariorum]|uniref:BTB and MATH domain-containing protein 42 n=1 Tax=Parasteatoda tepidariorum TaxID=114398 RepID=UPI001C71AE4D|nr:uncharacterized protein LOC122270360 [Parasteatoda tepidariorum]
MSEAISPFRKKKMSNEITRKVFTITWKIVNYSLNALRCGERLESPVFHAENFKGTKWFLSLYPKGDISFKHFISCYLHRNSTDDCKNEVSVSFILEIIDSQGNILSSTEFTDECKMYKSEMHGKHEFLTQEQLANSMKRWKEDTLVFRCHVFSETYKQEAIQWESRTEILVKNCSFRWKLKPSDLENWTKLIKLPFQNTTEFAITATASKEKVRFEIKKSNSMFDFLTTTLQMLKVGGMFESFFVGEIYKLEFFILDDNGVQMNVEIPSILFKTREGNPLLKFELSVGRKKVIDLTDFTLMCSISYANGMWTSEIESYSFGKVSKQFVVPSLSLQEDLKNMLFGGKFCDVKLRTAEKIVPAHKSLMCARSPVLSAIFDRLKLEGQIDTVDFTDTDAETVLSFLEFLYTDTITNTASDHIFKLILLANKYQVNALKEYCSDILMSKLSTENVCEVISVAEAINLLNLKLSALEYIKANKKDILSTPVWNDWVEKNLQLSNDILSKIVLD